MAACRTNASPRLIDWTKEFNPASLLLKVTKETSARMIAEGKRPTMAANWDRVASWYDNMRTLNLEEIVEKLVEQKIIRLDTAGIGGVAPVDQVDMDDAMVALSGLKAIFQSQAGALQDLADVVLRKVASGEDAIEAERMFARQSHNTNAIASTILDYDRKYGQGLALQNHKQSIAAKEFFGGNADRTAALETASKDILERGRELLNSGDKASIAEGSKLIQNYARIIKAVGSPEKVIDLETQRKGVGDLLWTVAVNGLLSKPSTFITNLAGGGYAFARPAFAILGALPTAAGLPGPGGRVEALKTIKIAMASLQGMSEAMRDGLTLGWQAAKTGHAIYDQNTDWGGLGQQMDIAMNGGWNGANFKALGVPINPGDTAWGAVNLLGTVIAAPGRAMQGGDEMIKHITYRGQLRAKGVRDAMAEGIDLTDEKAMAAKFAQVKELMFDPGAPDMRDEWAVNESWKLKMKVEGSEAAQQQSEVLQSVFQEENYMASKLYELVQAPVVGPLIRPFIPFIKTPVNILKQGLLDSTPIGAALKLGQVTIGESGFNVLRYQQNIIDEAAKNPAAYYQYLGQAAFGTALLGTVYTMAVNGQITGGGPQRWKMKEARKQEMHAVYLGSIRSKGFSDVYQIKIGDTIIPMSQLGEPFNTIAKIAIDIAEVSGYMTSEEQDNLMAVAAGVAVSGLSNASFLTGVNQLVETLVSPDGSGDRFTALGQQAAKVYTPFGALANYVDTIQDPYREIYRGNKAKPIWGDGGDWAQTIGGMLAPIRARIPGVGDNLPVLHDPIFGEPVPVSPGIGLQGVDILQLTVPFFPRGLAEADPLWEKVHQSIPKFQAPMPDGAPDLTQQELQKINKRTKTMTLGGQTLAQRLKDYYEQPHVAETLKALGTSHLVDEVIRGEVGVIVKEYRDVIFQEMLVEDPGLVERVAKHKQIAELKKEQGQAEAVQKETVALEQLRALASRDQRGIPRALDEPVIPSL
jgi:hypothetical protein